MILQVGSYRFQDGTVEVSIDRKANLDEGQNPWGYEETWDCKARPLNPTASASSMRTLLVNLENGIRPNRDVKLLLNTGAASHHQLLNASTIGGIRLVKPPSYPDGTGFQYGTFRSVVFTLAATVADPNRDSNVVQFSETLQTRGGGRLQGHLSPLTGAPIKQTLKQRTVWTAVQRGSATAIGGYPEPPDPLWPDSLVEPGGDPVTYGPVTRIGTSIAFATIQWEYLFEAAAPRFGRPHIWSF